MNRVAGIFLFLSIGCGASSSDDVGSLRSAAKLDNGMSLNGMSLNGMSLNGMSLNGAQLTGVLANGHHVSGVKLIGAYMTGYLSSGDAVMLHIDNIKQDAAPNQDVFSYYVSIRADDGWHPLCGDAASPAIPSDGLWNYGSNVPGGGSWSADQKQFTFSCPSGAITKCILLGYKPWLGKHHHNHHHHRDHDQLGKGDDGDNGDDDGDNNDDGDDQGNGNRYSHLDMRAYHQTCTRVIRADYCGNGSSFTQNNRVINIYDGVGIQNDTEAWEFEAEWEPTGAACISNLRLSQLQQGGTVPACFHPTTLHDCGNKIHFKTEDTLIMNEFLATQ